MVSDTTVEYSCLGKVHQVLFGISLGVPGQAVRRGKLLPGERDVLRVLLGKLVLGCARAGREQQLDVCSMAAAPWAPPDNEQC